jgi:hypothetical protein
MRPGGLVQSFWFNQFLVQSFVPNMRRMVNEAERGKLLSQEFGKGVAGGHPESPREPGSQFDVSLALIAISEYSA